MIQERADSLFLLITRLCDEMYVISMTLLLQAGSVIAELIGYF
jgi:hypothetical protein